MSEVPFGWIIFITSVHFRLDPTFFCTRIHIHRYLLYWLDTEYLMLMEGHDHRLWPPAAGTSYKPQFRRPS